MIALMKTRDVVCSFCGRPGTEVGEMVVGRPSGAAKLALNERHAFICSECVRRCNQMIAGKDFASVHGINRRGFMLD